MTKPAASANVNYLDLTPWPEPVTSAWPCRDRNGAKCFRFYAPGWRNMRFTSLDAAKAKLERHRGFVSWVTQ